MHKKPKPRKSTNDIGACFLRKYLAFVLIIKTQLTTKSHGGQGTAAPGMLGEQAGGKVLHEDGHGLGRDRLCVLQDSVEPRNQAAMVKIKQEVGDNKNIKTHVGTGGEKDGIGEHKNIMSDRFL